MIRSLVGFPDSVVSDDAHNEQRGHRPRVRRWILCDITKDLGYVHEKFLSDDEVGDMISTLITNRSEIVSRKICTYWLHGSILCE
jgi:hypothetical protein